MTKKIKHIIAIIVTGCVLLFISVATSLAQEGGKAVPFFEITQCDTLELMVEEMPGDEYTWEIYSDAESDFAITEGDMESAIYFENGDYRDVSSVRVINLPVGEYFVKVTAWDEVECTNNLMVFRMEVLEPPPPIVYGDSVCVDEPVNVRVVFTGTGPWDIYYGYGDDENAVNFIGNISDPDYTITITEPLPVGETKFWIIEMVDGCAIAREFSEEERPNTGILIYPKPTKQPIYLKED